MVDDARDHEREEYMLCLKEQMLGLCQGRYPFLIALKSVPDNPHITQ
jgi:hypothetical protein